MGILFKDDRWIYYIDDNNILDRSVHASILFHNINLDNIPHLDDAKILYHYKHRNGDYLPVYYERNGVFITFIDESYIYQYSEYYTKDYTLVNLNLLEDGNII